MGPGARPVIHPVTEPRNRASEYLVQIELWSERTIFESNMKELGSKIANFESKTAELGLIKPTSGFKEVKLWSQIAVFLGSYIVNLGSKMAVSVSIMIKMGSKMAL